MVDVDCAKSYEDMWGESKRQKGRRVVLNVNMFYNMLENVNYDKKIENLEELVNIKNLNLA